MWLCTVKRSLTIYKSVKSHLDIYPSEAAFNSAREDNGVGKSHSIFFSNFLRENDRLLNYQLLPTKKLS